MDDLFEFGGESGQGRVNEMMGDIMRMIHDEDYGRHRESFYGTLCVGHCEAGSLKIDIERCMSLGDWFCSFLP